MVQAPMGDNAYLCLFPSGAILFWVDEKAYEASNQAGCMAKNQRADVKNPNNPSHKAAADNRANQLNPNNIATKSGKGKK